jgi:hypothetical protein
VKEGEGEEVTYNKVDRISEDVVEQRLAVPERDIFVKHPAADVKYA